MTSCTGSVRGGFEKSQLCWELNSEWEGSTFGARWGQMNLCATGATRVAWGRGADEKASIERLCISLPCVETFNPKVIKGFVPELRSRECFLCFGIPMFYVYMLWTFYVRYTYPDIWIWYTMRKVWINHLFLKLEVNSKTDGILWVGLGNQSRRTKTEFKQVLLCLGHYW